ncbi:MAG: MmgE/PrpD family protein [Acidimicrobiales bacterium]
MSEAVAEQDQAEPGVAGSAVREIAARAVAIRRRGIGDDVARAAARAVVDWFAATVAGSLEPPATALRAALLHDEMGSSRLVPDGRPASRRTAALINATASHTMEMDDIFRDGIYHPGSPTVAAALAVAEDRHAPGSALLRAVAIGYEVGDRVAASVNPAHYRFWHTTGTVGTLGAAAAVAYILELDEERFAHALATATTMAAGLQQAFRADAMSKPLHAGHAAEAGTLAALAAAEGFTGALAILDGPVGFGVAMAEAPDWHAAAESVGTAPMGITQATVKNHSCCGHTFAAVDAALELRSEGVRAADIAHLLVETYSVATTVAGNPAPKTPFEAKFSTAFCVAAALETGSVRLRTFEDPVLTDPAIRGLADLVTLRADAEMDRVFPGRRSARVTAELVSGGSVVVERHTRKGDPDDPLTDAELRAKFDDLTGGVLGAEAASSLEEALWHLGELGDVSELPLGAPDMVASDA